MLACYIIIYDTYRGGMVMKHIRYVHEQQAPAQKQYLLREQHVSGHRAVFKRNWICITTLD